MEHEVDGQNEPTWHVANRLDQKLLDGSLGRFWIYGGAGPPFDSDSDPFSGYISLADHSIAIRVLSNGPPSIDPLDGSSVFGWTENGGVLVPDVYRSTSSLSIGGGRTSTHQFLADSLIGGLADDDATAGNFEGASMTLLGGALPRWAAMDAVDQDVDTDASGRVKQVKVTLKSLPDLAAPMDRRSRLRLQSNWSTSRNSTQGIAVETGLRIGIEKATPVLAELLVPLERIQDLLGLAHDGRVGADFADVRISGFDRSHPLWSSQLMLEANSFGDRARPAMFSLADIRGPRGLVRWIRMYDRFPLSVAPVANRLRHGAATPEVQILEIGAAIEQFVNAHRRTTTWASNGTSKAEVLAKHAGAPFEAWVGPSAAWAKRFWSLYNNIKHAPNSHHSPREAFLMAETGYRLLAFSLLYRSSGSKAAGKRMLLDHRLTGIGRAVSEP